MIVYSTYSEMVDEANQPLADTQVEPQQSDAKELIASAAKIEAVELLPQKVEAITPPPDPLSHAAQEITQLQQSRQPLSPIAAAVCAAELPILPITEIPTGALQVQAVTTTELTTTDLTTTDLQPVTVTQLPPVAGSVMLPIQITGNGAIQYINAETLEVTSTPPKQSKQSKKVVDASGE